MNNKNPYILPGSRVVVLGYGVTGRALDFFAGADLVLISPGVNHRQPVIKQLRQQGVPIYGELAIAAPILKQRGTKVVAITGSNGKTTVTSLVGDVLRNAGREVFIGGNIGVPLYEYCRQEKAEEYVVVEVSSFQLENMGSFAPDVGVLLNISPDHLDWHGSMDNYIAAKMALFAHQQQQDMAIAERKYCQLPGAGFAGCRRSFGRNPEDDAHIAGESLLLREEKEISIPLPAGTAGFAADNFAAAALALRALGISAEIISHGFAAFQRPPHRLEEVAELADVLYINDSKATNTGSVLGALQQQNRPVILIAGGRGKGEDYSLLCAQVKEKVRDLIVIGEAADELATALDGCTVIHTASSVEQAVSVAHQLAAAGDVVLLSPACASFDMFSGYRARGECFRKAVAALGHLFPAIAAAEKFQQHSAVEVLFIGTDRKLDGESLARYGFTAQTISSAGIKGKNPLQLMKALCTLPVGYVQALSILRRFRPDIVLAVGGYVTGPVIVAARTLGIPVVLHEQNSIAGLANRKLGFFAEKICLSLPGSEKDVGKRFLG